MAARGGPGARLAGWLEGAAALLLLALMLLVLVDVVLRSVVNRPLPWSTEVLEVLLGAMIFLLYPVLARNGGHITVDLIPFPAPVRRLQRRLSALAGALLFSIIGWCLGRQALRAAEFGDGTTLLHWPYAWILGAMAAASALTVLGFVASAWQNNGAEVEPS
ncbi:MAG: TRAP transporter small permease [Rubrivivax sp.]|nr:TRAP transporter small permease [Rubrivivax sp.]